LEKAGTFQPQIDGADGRRATTMLACAPAAVDRKRRFLEARGRVRYWRLDRGLLVLHDAVGEPILRFWSRDT
jgi:heat shock protein HslJ